MACYKIYLRSQQHHPAIQHLPHALHSKPFPRRLRSRTLTHTPLIPPPLPQPFLRPQLQLPIQLRTRLLPVYEVAKPAPHAPFPAIEPTARFSEIGDGGKFAVDGPGGVPATVEGVAGLLRRVFVLEARVDVADQICRSNKPLPQVNFMASTL